jgi:hypothetical protein
LKKYLKPIKNSAEGKAAAVGGLGVFKRTGQPQEYAIPQSPGGRPKKELDVFR